MASARYLLDNQATGAAARLEALATIFDPWTFWHLERLPVEAGWRCWEVGAGGTSVLRWLADRVGPRGGVLGTDIDVSSARAAVGPTVEVRRHDVGRDPTPRGRFDLVHARLVLVHVAQRDQALCSMVGALGPGGWLIVEDADPALQPLSCLDPQAPGAELANRLRRGFRALMADRGVDLAYGRKLPGLLRSAGLTDVWADAYFPVASPACASLELATVNLLRDQLITHGVATRDEIDRHLGTVASGSLDLVQPPLVTAGGRKAAVDD